MIGKIKKDMAREKSLILSSKYGIQIYYITKEKIKCQY